MIEHPDYIMGNKKQFAQFISNLGDEKIIIVSHTDLDGLASAKIAQLAINANEIIFLNYSDLGDTLFDRLKKTKAKKIIFTDLFFKNVEIIKKIEKLAEILIIDHHSPDVDLNSDRTVHINAQGYCAAYLCYDLFGRIVNLEKYSWLVAAASISDVQYFNNKEFMKEVFAKYGDKFEFISDIDLRKSGKFWDYQWNITLALIANDPDYSKVFEAIIEKFEIPALLREDIHKVAQEYIFWKKRFEKEKKTIDEGYYWEFNPKYKITGFIINELSFACPNKTLIFVSKGEEIYKFSVRRQDGKVDLNEFSRELCKNFDGANAGGHKKASGGFFPLKYIDEFKKRLKI